LACFERVLVTGPSAWDRAQAGEEGVLSPAAERGAELFFSNRSRCTSCHSGPNFTDEAFHNVGTGAGKRPDSGRFQVTNDERDRGAFRTPTLRNVARTGPYFHDARYDSLADVVAWFHAGGVANDESGVPPNELVPLDLSLEERAEVVAFLESLSSDLPPVETGRLPP
jgi:cytochrome c peroxidase